MLFLLATSHLEQDIDNSVGAAMSAKYLIMKTKEGFELAIDRGTSVCIHMYYYEAVLVPRPHVALFLGLARLLLAV